MTKIFMPQARFVRRPIYIRGKSSIVGGKNLTTGRFCRFDLDGKKKTLFIGNNCEMGDMTHIVAHEKVEIGNNVLIASKVFISDTSHGNYLGNGETSMPLTAPNQRVLITKPIFIEDNVWIGENVCIMYGVKIGRGSVIGANAVITKDVPECSIAVGVPANIIGYFDFESRSWKRT